MNELYYLINNSDWYAIVNHYEQKFIAETLLFEEGRLLVYKMLFNKERDDSLQEYATKLLEEIRRTHFKEWSKDWRNDIFLGDVYYMTLNYDERYASYMRAYEKANPKPSSLLISIASCYLSPQPPISLSEAKKMVEKALEKEMSIEGVVLLRGIYSEIKDQKNFEHWDKILTELEKKICICKMHGQLLILNKPNLQL